MDFDWLTHPDHNLEGIFLYLDVKSLLRVTEKCKSWKKSSHNRVNCAAK